MSRHRRQRHRRARLARKRWLGHILLHEGYSFEWIPAMAIDINAVIKKWNDEILLRTMRAVGRPS